MLMPKYLVVFDRDGTLHRDMGPIGATPGWEKGLALFPYTVEAVATVYAVPGTVIGVASNQGYVAQGIVTEEQVRAANDRLRTLLENAEASLPHDQTCVIPRGHWAFCPEVTEEYAAQHGILPETYLYDHYVVKEAPRRKPGIGMLRQIARAVGMRLEDFSERFVVGDRATDVMTGLNAGGIGVFLMDTIHEEEIGKVEALMTSENERMIILADDTLDAAKRIAERLNR
ncbi:MAG: HAD hydrolase-like protein [Candidatus Woesearchaeota archaeon]